VAGLKSQRGGAEATCGSPAAGAQPRSYARIALVQTVPALKIVAAEVTRLKLNRAFSRRSEPRYLCCYEGSGIIPDTLVEST